MTMTEPTSRAPYNAGTCDCGRPAGQCVKGDRDYCDDMDDDEGDGEFDLSEECGRWVNGGLSTQCSQAGTEWCDWECPFGLPRQP